MLPLQVFAGRKVAFPKVSGKDQRVWACSEGTSQGVQAPAYHILFYRAEAEKESFVDDADLGIEELDVHHVAHETQQKTRLRSDRGQTDLLSAFYEMFLDPQKEVV